MFEQPQAFTEEYINTTLELGYRFSVVPEPGSRFTYPGSGGWSNKFV